MSLDLAPSFPDAGPNDVKAKPLTDPAIGDGLTRSEPETTGIESRVASHTPVQTLPALEGFDSSLLKSETVTIPDAGSLDVLVPSDNRYVCEDPNAPVLICVPGFGTDAQTFLRQLPLGALAHLHFLQSPSDPMPGEDGLGHFAGYIEAYVHERKLTDHPGGIVLYGSSMGGAVSLATALRGRFDLRGLVLVGTFGNRRHIRFLGRVFAPLVPIFPRWLCQSIARSMVRRSRMFGEFNEEKASFLLRAGIRIPNSGYLRRALRGLTRMNQIPAAAGLDLPTLVIHGTNDLVLPYGAGEELASSIPGAKFEGLDGAGHALFITHYRKTNDLVACFLSGLNA